MRRSILSAVLSLLAAGCADPPPAAPPNVIVVCIDSLRADRLAPYGGDEATSRTLTAIAREGVVFDRAFTVASWTKPSVASLLTGLYPSQHGLIASHETRVDLLPDATTTLAETLKAGGYRTAGLTSNPVISGRDQALVDARKNVVSLALVAMPENIFRIFELSGTTDFFAIYDSLDSALMAFSPNQR